MTVQEIQDFIETNFKGLLSESTLKRIKVVPCRQALPHDVLTRSYIPECNTSYVPAYYAPWRDEIFIDAEEVTKVNFPLDLIIHHELRHKGLLDFGGSIASKPGKDVQYSLKFLQSTMNDLYIRFKSEIDAMAAPGGEYHGEFDAYADDLKRRKLTEEFFCINRHFFGKNRWYDAVFAPASRFLRTLGISKGLSGFEYRLLERNVERVLRNERPEIADWIRFRHSLRLWCGKDARFTDDEGVPPILYHGHPEESDADFLEQPVQGEFTHGLVFKGDPEAASQGSKAVVPCYLKLTKPFVVIEPEGDFHLLMDLRGRISQLDGAPVFLEAQDDLPEGYTIVTDEIIDDTRQTTFHVAPLCEDSRDFGPERSTRPEAIVAYWDSKNGVKYEERWLKDFIDAHLGGPQKFVEMVKASGYDSIVVQCMDDGGRRFEEVCVFGIAQVKSQFNCGLFDAETRDIRF